MNTEMVMISKEDLDYFRKRDEWLSCLEDAGLDGNCALVEQAAEIYKELLLK